MKKKSLKSLILNKKTISNLSDYYSIVGGYHTEEIDSVCHPCVPDTDAGNGASCEC